MQVVSPALQVVLAVAGQLPDSSSAREQVSQFVESHAALLAQLMDDAADGHRWVYVKCLVLVFAFVCGFCFSFCGRKQKLLSLIDKAGGVWVCIRTVHVRSGGHGYGSLWGALRYRVTAARGCPASLMPAVDEHPQPFCVCSGSFGLYVGWCAICDASCP